MLFCKIIVIIISIAKSGQLIFPEPFAKNITISHLGFGCVDVEN